MSEIEGEIDAAFDAALNFSNISKDAAIASLLDVAESLMAGHGTVPEGARDPVLRCHLNITNGVSAALR
jgi:hypothetical protein